MHGPYSETEWRAIDDWWFNHGPKPKFAMTTERWIMTVMDLRSALGFTNHINELKGND